ncbi:hypothetical protein [Saccharothrix coeruleofusca]|uniref:hypothetical protein n=1 Tax=Saccharothrix coeruleofusca TaxID=33919 RepID=UPI00166FC698|nr:hypothetical protein [Saccharothrix coeruleofusca]
MKERDTDDEGRDERYFDAADEYEEDDFGGGGLFAVAAEPRTICPLCGGIGFIANHVFAAVRGAPGTVDNGRQCPHCRGARSFPGMVIPV